MSASPPLLQPADLEAGDVLLHMGAGELSKLIAWVGDSAYSHAALVVDDGQLIEAAASGVRRAGLTARTQMTNAFHYVDVFRPTRATLRDTHERAALLEAVHTYIGRPYPMTSLLTLGLVCAVRNKIPGDPELRRSLRMALDAVIANDASQVVCSELVYRGFDEARTTPPHALRLEVITRPAQGTPLPDVDLDALAAECLDDYNRSLPKPKPMLALAAAPDPSELGSLMREARAKLGLDGLLTSSANDYAPNPKTVLPADLEFSPDLQLIGRLAMSA